MVIVTMPLPSEFSARVSSPAEMATAEGHVSRRFALAPVTLPAPGRNAWNHKQLEVFSPPGLTCTRNRRAAVAGPGASVWTWADTVLASAVNHAALISPTLEGSAGVTWSPSDGAVA